ncbi:MAG: ParB N-terminal domain-containing protein [Pseudonocardiaceae bacterium]
MSSGHPPAQADAHAPDTCPTVEVIDLRDLRFEHSPRLSGENIEHTRLLAEVASRTLPPIIVHRQSMRIIDGLHRVRAARLRGDRTIRAQFFSGDDREAFLIAVEANKIHGLPLSLSDRKAAAARLISMYPDRSDRSIAASTNLSDKTVGGLRSTADLPKSNARTGADGRKRPIDGAERRNHAAQLLVNRPGSSVRDIARGAGISLATAWDVCQRVARGQDPVPPGLHRATNRAGPTPRPTPHPRNPDRNAHAVLENLKSDPALRSSEAGRSLLRWLHSHAIQQTHYNECLERVPPHCCELIADLAESYGATWFALATQLRNLSSQAPMPTS